MKQPRFQEAKKSLSARLGRKVKRTPVFIWLLMALIAIVPAAFLLLALGVVLMFVDDSWDRARLPEQIAAAGFPSLLASDTSPASSKPGIWSTSPDQAWTILAPWTINQGYDWQLKNNRTGQIYFQGLAKKEDPDCWSVPTRLGVLWSPGSHYLAINCISDVGMEQMTVICLAAGSPQFLKMNESFSRETGVGLRSTDQKGAGWADQALRTRALGWDNDSDLRVLISVDEYEASQPNEIVAVERQTYRFEGPTYVMAKSRTEFSQSFITDL